MRTIRGRGCFAETASLALESAFITPSLPEFSNAVHNAGRSSCAGKHNRYRQGASRCGCFGLLTAASTRLGAYSLIFSDLSTVCNKSKFVGCGGEGGGEAGGAVRYAGDGSVRRTAATRQFNATLTHSPIKSSNSRGVHESVERQPPNCKARAAAWEYQIEE